MSRRGVVLALVVAFGLGLLTAWAVFSRPGDAAVAPAEEKAPEYYCPMHPTIVSDRPGDCPICGMRLVPRQPEDHTTQDAAGPAVAGAAGPEVPGQAPVMLSERKRQLIGVRTAAVQRKPLARTIRTVGRVTYDETRLHHVHTKVEGYVEHLHANATGELVRRGEPLLVIYSPELLASSQEFLLALRTRERLAASADPALRDSGAQLVDSARRRLRLFDLSDAQIDALEQRGEAPRTVTLPSPVTGYIVNKMVLEGQRIEPGTNLLDIADLRRVWVLADVYEYELPFVKEGQTATLSLSYLPGERLEGRVTLVYPVLSEATRTVKVRLEFDNPGLKLKPEMFGDVELTADLGERLVVPESAVLSTGQRDLVFVDRGEGLYEPRQLRLGVRLEDEIEVLEGLQPGERVVTSGNFLIDSESRMRSALGAATAKPAEPNAPAHQH